MSTLSLTNATVLTGTAVDASKINANNDDIEAFYRPTPTAGGLDSATNFLTNTGILPEQLAESNLRGVWSGWQDTLTFRLATATPSDSQNREALFAALGAYIAPTNLTIIDANFFLDVTGQTITTVDWLADPLQCGLLIGTRPEPDERDKQDATNADEDNPNAHRLLPAMVAVGDVSFFRTWSHDATMSVEVECDIFVPQGTLVIPCVQLASRPISTASQNLVFRACWSINYAGRPA